MSTIHDRRRVFRRLYEQAGCFVMPTPWNVGTARYLQHLGFKALATTSAGVAFSQGFPDTEWAVPRDLMLAHMREIVAATDLPVNADFESAYAHEPEDVAANVRLGIQTGVAGLSIQDMTGDRSRPLYPLPLAVERIAAARAEIDASAMGVVLTACTACWPLQLENAFEEALRRVVAYAEAGADCLYAPGAASREEISAMVAAVAPKSVQIVVPAASDLTLKELEDLGVKCVSGGSGLCRVAWGAFMQAAQELRRGSFSMAYVHAAPFDELNSFFRQDLAKGRRSS